MKKLGELFQEGDKKKAHKTRDGAGVDDKKYFAMMDEYKQLRRTDREAANKLLEKALLLGKEGDVSKDAKLGAAYL